MQIGGVRIPVCARSAKVLIGVEQEGMEALRKWRFGVALLLAAVWVWPTPLRAERIENAVAVFAALDKVTARISEIEVNIGETFKFGALKVTPRACYSRPPTEPPKTSAFVEVDEIKLNGQTQRLFTGWMFAQSPGLNAVEHPVYDVWLTNCKTASGDASAPRRP